MQGDFRSGFASASLQPLFEKFANFATREIYTLLGADNGLRKLQRTLLRIRGLLDYLEDVRMRFLNETTKKALAMWIEDLKKLCYDADDILDDLSFQLQNLNGSDQISADNVRELLSSPLNLLVPHRIEEICKMLEDIADEMNTFFINEMVKFEGHKSMSENNNNTTSFVDQELVLGRDDEKQQIIIDTLTETEFRVDVIPIMGMAGLGKTTFAQFVYNSEELEEYFGLKMWVVVSMQFDLLRISKSILESATNGSCRALSNLDLVQRELKQVLSNQRFLLVLDDFWSEKHGDWEALSAPFRYSRMGSKIIVTTRSATVSSIVGTLPFRSLGMLSQENIWQIMRQRAFSNRNVNISEDMEQIGMAIAAKCSGLPLAAKTIGSVLHSRFSDKGWRSILESELWDLPQENNVVVSSLALSYYHLPAHLKKCFAYCSIFPRGYEFDVDDLILRWMAEGFLDSTVQRNMEEIGRGYFMDLVNMSLFLCTEGDLYNPKKCKMHDLIHSMAELVSTGICFRMKDDTSHWFPLYRNVRHLSLSHEGMELISQTAFPKYQSLRTFILMCTGGNNIQIPRYDLLLKFRCLRVLDLSNAGIVELPDSIDHLKHLRYLNLSRNQFKKLPRGITKLLGMQTFILNNCNQLLELPLNLMNLTNLRHLYFNSWHNLSSMPRNLGRLINLQTLPAFIVGRYEECGIGELEKMSSLAGSICLSSLENVRNLEEAHKASLDKKPSLDKIELVWTNGGNNNNNHEEVLGGLRPHLNARELKIINFRGSQLPGWLSKPDRKFTSIHLQSCSSCLVLPTLGKLPLLKVLHVEDASSLVQIDRQFCSVDNSLGFPSLKSLTFRNMPQWTEWNDLGDNDMPCLRDLTIEDCPGLRSLPVLHGLESLQKLKIKSCSSLESIQGQLPPSLRKVIISEATQLSEWNGLGANELPFLHSLTIGCCPSLISLPSLHRLPSLVELKLISCPNLQALPEELPDSLGNLIIMDSNIIKVRCRIGFGEDWLKIRSIQKVEIDGMEIPMQA